MNAAKKAGEWQTAEITFVGRIVTIVLNGEPVIELPVGDQRLPIPVFPALEPASGLSGMVDEHRPSDFVDILEWLCLELMLLAKRVIAGFRPTKH